MTDVTEEAINDVQEQDVSGAPTEEPTQATVEETVVEETSTEETTDTTPEETPSEAPKEEHSQTRQEKRTSRLAEINQQLRQENQALQQAQPAPQEQTRQEQQRLSDLLQGREEIQPQELDDIATKWAGQYASQNIANVDAIVDMKLAQREALSNAKSEIDQVLTREEFNTESDSYNPNLEKAVLKTWEKAARVQYDSNGNVVSFDPTVSIREIADNFQEVGTSYANKKITETNQVLSQQKDESAVTSGTKTATKEPDFKELSISEMEKRLGFHRV